MPVSLTRRKANLVARNQLLRRTLVLQSQSLTRYIGLADLGAQAARGLAGLLASRQRKT